MLQFLSMLRRPAPARRVACEDVRRWRADPLSQPALARMSERELGDLPIQPAIWRERG
ncbi:MAG TPA: hypothetical protein VGN97_00505 [Mesorhizobium sp.]|jgi:uncharacterized protein YjiS (DUF1127 family)|nr:hypothetical protein [Mesorhizobium sp.]